MESFFSSFELNDLAKVIDDINGKKAVCIQQIMNYFQEIHRVPESKQYELQSQIVKLLDEAADKGLIIKSPVLYKVSPYGKKYLNETISESVDYSQKSHDSTGDSDDENTDGSTSEGDYTANDCSSQEGSIQQEDVRDICIQCYNASHSYKNHSHQDYINRKLQSVRDYESSSDETDNIDRIKPCKTGIENLQKSSSFNKMNVCDCDIIMASMSGNSTNIPNDVLRNRRCCTRFKKCRQCGEPMVLRRYKRSRDVSNKKGNNQSERDDRKCCPHCQRKRSRKRKHCDTVSSDTSVSSRSERTDRKKDNQNKTDKSKTPAKKDPQKSTDNNDQKIQSKYSTDKTSSQYSNENQRNENGDKQTQKPDIEAKTVENIMYGRQHHKRYKEPSGKPKRRYKDDDRRHRKPDSNSDNDSKNSTSRKRKRRTKTPPPDPTSKPGANGLERKVSNHSNPSLPYLPPREHNIEKEDDDEEDFYEKKNLDDGSK